MPSVRWKHTGAGLRAAGFLWLLALVAAVITETPTNILVAFGVVVGSTYLTHQIKRRRLGSQTVIHPRPARQSAS
jgi:hypothetical protein